MLPVLMDLALEPVAPEFVEQATQLWPYLLIGALVIAAIVISVVLIVKTAKKKKK